jgi:thioredoxin reductase (NADPH)
MPAWDYDLIIIGGGPAGLTAGIYAGRARLCALLVEKLIHGGQMMTTDLIENYPGFPEGISGFDLSDRMRKQAERFELLIKTAEVLEVIPGNPVHTVVLEDRRVTTPTIIIASGAKYRHLGVPGEDKLTGHGVSFCATCDGALYRDQEIAMVGGGDNALTEVLFLERFARKIHLIHRRDQFRACKYLQERVLLIDKVQVHWDTVVTECKGQSELDALELRNLKTGVTTTLPVAGAN